MSTTPPTTSQTSTTPPTTPPMTSTPNAPRKAPKHTPQWKRDVDSGSVREEFAFVTPDEVPSITDRKTLLSLFHTYRDIPHKNGPECNYAQLMKKLLINGLAYIMGGEEK